MSQRLNKDRYAIHGKWRRQDEGPNGERLIGVEYWVADLLEKRSGFVWRDGAHRVRVTVPCRYKSTTHYGESAWSAAARLIADVGYEARRAAWSS